MENWTRLDLGQKQWTNRPRYGNVDRTERCAVLYKFYTAFTDLAETLKKALVSNNFLMETQKWKDFKANFDWFVSSQEMSKSKMLFGIKSTDQNQANVKCRGEFVV